jgi:plasmid stability protein
MTRAAWRQSATLTIRNVDPRLKEELRVRAAQHGHSMEAELRDILRQALAAGEAKQEAPEIGLGEAIRRRMAPFGGVELEPHPPVPVRDPPAFNC